MTTSRREVEEQWRKLDPGKDAQDTATAQHDGSGRVERTLPSLSSF
jgi:hypothetical protein